jgi:ATP adenylyltransferase
MTDEGGVQDGAGDPDGFQRLWMPHRMAYIQGENKPATAGAGDCPFCRVQRLPDEEGLVVRRGAVAFAVLNLYPYSPGHVLVCTNRHVADYPDLTAEEVAEVGALTQRALEVLRVVSGAQGFNLGINQGDVGGAGISAHLHQHVVPRWGGDTNFMAVVARTKVMPQLLAETRSLIADAWEESDGSAGRK